MPLLTSKRNGAFARVFFAPVDLLIRTISFAPSLMLLLLVFPDAYVAYLLFRQTTASVEFSRKEIDGVDYISAARGFQARVDEQRVLAQSAASDPAAASTLASARAAGDASVEQIAALESRLGEPLGTAATWSDIRKRYEDIKTITDPVKLDQAYAQLAAKISTDLIMNQAGNNSNLILDPDLDSYWMMDAFVIKLPALSELATQAGCQIIAAKADATIDVDERLALAGTAKLIDSTVSDLINVDLSTALDDNEKFNPSEHREGNRRLRALEPRFKAVAAELARFTDTLHHQLVATDEVAAGGLTAGQTQSAIAALLSLSQEVAPELNRLCDERVQRYAHTRQVGLLVAIAALCGITYVFNGFYRSLSLARRKIEEEHERLQGDIVGLLTVVSEAADGDLRVRAQVGEGALGNVGDAFNQMIERWQQLIGAINQQLSITNQAVSELRSSSDRMAAGASRQAEEVHAVASSVQRMSAQIHRVSGNAETAAQAAQRTQESAQEGNTSVREVIEGMETLKAEVAAGAKKIKSLGDRSLEITSIVATIAKISEQTNMLALNAAIEAARAGEHGRGFSVVADEVRKLAERTATATQEIEKLVRAIQEETSQSVGAIERQSQAVEHEGRAVAGAGTALSRIRTESQQSSALVTDIAKIAKVQAEDAAVFATTMDRISQIAGETAEGANGSLGIAQSLAELSDQLRESVTQFKVA